MAAEHGPAWFDADLLDPAQRRAAIAYLRLRRPIGVVGQGERNDAFLDSLTVRSGGTFIADGLEPWGLLETAEHGAVVVPAEITMGARLPRLPLPLRRLGARIGPAVRRLASAQASVEERPSVRRLRDRFVAAAVAHSDLHRQLEAWRPEMP
ncbi:MAG TPA: hypothetical protein VI121_01510 [Agromyces sp.]